MRPTSRRGVAVVLTSTASRTCCLDILAPPMGLTSPSDVVIALLPTNSSGIRASASTKARVSRPAAISTFLLGRIKSGSIGVGAEGPQGAEVIGISGSRRTDRAGSRSLRANSPVPRVCASPVVAEGTPRPLFCVMLGSVGKMERGDLSANRLFGFQTPLFLCFCVSYGPQFPKNMETWKGVINIPARSLVFFSFEGTKSYLRTFGENYVTESMIVWRCVWLFLSTP